MTKREINKLSVKQRMHLLKNVVDSFDVVVVTACYGAFDFVNSSNIKQGAVEQSTNTINETVNGVIITTDIMTG